MADSGNDKSAAPSVGYAAPRAGRFQSLRDGVPLSGRRRGLRLWAAVTIGLYVAACIVLFVPIGVTLFNKEDASSFVQSLSNYEFWVVAAILVIAQMLMLAVPVRASWDYQIKPRHLMVPLITASVLMAILTAGVALSLLTIPFRADPPAIAVTVAGATVLASWVFWYLIFARYRHASPDAVVSRVQRLLLHGSMVELIVAVGCHIWVRRRGDCSAPALTFFAICAGLAIMLLAFGPSVLYLFVARVRRMKPESSK